MNKSNITMLPMKIVLLRKVNSILLEIMPITMLQLAKINVD